MRRLGEKGERKNPQKTTTNKNVCHSKILQFKRIERLRCCHILRYLYNLSNLNFLRMEGILRKLKKLMKLTQKWKDFENNGIT
jgi:hypothetical protein